MFLDDRDGITNNTPKLQLIVSASMSKGDFLHFGTGAIAVREEAQSKK